MRVRQRCVHLGDPLPKKPRRKGRKHVTLTDKRVSFGRDNIPILFSELVEGIEILRLCGARFAYPAPLRMTSVPNEMVEK